jgi:hydrogenase nickel incorporation protein HypB
MCNVCGCGQGETQIEGKEHVHHDHEHNHSHHHTLTDKLHDYGQGPAHTRVPGMDQHRMVQIEQGILEKNNHYAKANREYFDKNGIFTLNLLSSPGAGKTTLLINTINALKERFPIAVIEGDQQTSNDADCIRKTGVPALQINTGKGCHLDAHMVGHAVEALAPQEQSILFIENVGNLICPATFDLGEAHKVVILSVTEGDDKPLKYSNMFHAADIMIINKVDLLPYVDFDITACEGYARRVNPAIVIIRLSATSSEGMDSWFHCIESGTNDLSREHTGTSAST